MAECYIREGSRESCGYGDVPLAHQALDVLLPAAEGTSLAYAQLPPTRLQAVSGVPRMVQGNDFPVVE